MAVDTLLHLRDRLGRDNLHLLEWQGYKDELAALEQEHQRTEQALLHAIARTVEDTVSARFPATPVGVLAPLMGLRDAERLQTLLAAVLRAPGQESAERLPREAAAATQD